MAFAPNGDFWCVQFQAGTLVKFSKDGRRLMEVGKRVSLLHAYARRPYLPRERTARTKWMGRMPS